MRGRDHPRFHGRPLDLLVYAVVEAENVAFEYYVEYSSSRMLFGMWEASANPMALRQVSVPLSCGMLVYGLEMSVVTRWASSRVSLFEEVYDIYGRSF